MRKNSQLPLLAPTLLPPDGSGPSLLRPVSKLSGPPSHPYGKHFLDSESEDAFLDWVNEGPLPPAAARGVADTSQMKQSNWDDVLHEADQVEADHGKNQRRRLVKTSDLPKQQQHTTDAQGSRMELGGDKNTGARGADEDDLYDDFGFGEIAQPEPEADAIDVTAAAAIRLGNPRLAWRPPMRMVSMMGQQHLPLQLPRAPSSLLHPAALHPLRAIGAPQLAAAPFLMAS